MASIAPNQDQTNLEVTSASEEQLVVFRLDTENYGIDIFRVNEIIRMRDITPIPQSQAHIRGLVNLRGKTIPVVDLRARFMIGATDQTEKARIIVVENSEGNVGIIVDEVREVLTLQANQIEETPPMIGGLTSEFVRGVANCDGGLVTLLDLDKALSA